MHSAPTSQSTNKIIEELFGDIRVTCRPQTSSDIQAVAFFNKRFQEYKEIVVQFMV